MAAATPFHRSPEARAGTLRGANVAIGARKTPIRSTSVEYGTTTGSTCVDSLGNLTARSRWIVLRRSTMDRNPMILGRRRFMAVTIPLTWSTVSYTHLRAHETRHDLVCR